MNLNKVFLLGNLTFDPETRTTSTGQNVCTFRIATNRVWTDRQTGEKKQRVEYHQIVAWGKLADIASQYLTKGRLVFVEGRLNTRTWEDNSGNKRSKTEIIAENLQLGPRPNNIQEREEKETNEEEDIPIIEEDNIDAEDIPI